jgi:hypothetical protein
MDEGEQLGRHLSFLDSGTTEKKRIYILFFVIFAFLVFTLFHQSHLLALGSDFTVPGWFT